jgi:hypothetical protein
MAIIIIMQYESISEITNLNNIRILNQSSTIKL